jgi:hypothetical protein
MIPNMEFTTEYTECTEEKRFDTRPSLCALCSLWFKKAYAAMFSHGTLRAMRFSNPHSTRPGPIS